MHDGGEKGCFVLAVLVGVVLTLGLLGFFGDVNADAIHITTPTSQKQPASTSYYKGLARQAAIEAGIPPDLFVRQINMESGFNPNAQSPAGAQGIAQFMPETARGLGIDPWNPEAALKAAAQLMARYQARYGGDYAKALAAYNAGSGTLQSALERCGLSWQRCLPAETQHYIAVIMG
jgi:soluble lytic murein transglycosylase-like protein